MNNNEESYKIELEVNLSIIYQRKEFTYSIDVKAINNETKSELEFNMGELIDKLFIKLDKNYASEFILSYYLNNEQEDNYEDIPTFKYLGQVNKDNNQFHNMLFKIPKDKKIHLKLRQKIKREKLLIPEFFEENEAENVNFSLKEISLNEEEEKTNNYGGRGKEKTIEYAIIKVFKWMYLVKYKNLTFCGAAKLIGCPKKTLEHYKNVLIESRGSFDFKKNAKKKMNKLIKLKRNRKE